MTDFFEVISLSAPHIYRSALVLVSHSSMVWELYRQHIPPSGPRVVIGFPGSLDSCTAIAMVPMGDCDPAWSQCGQFVAVSKGSAVEILNSADLESMMSLEAPNDHTSSSPCALTFSPDGRVLACAYSPRTNKTVHGAT